MIIKRKQSPLRLNRSHLALLPINATTKAVARAEERRQRGLRLLVFAVLVVVAVAVTAVVS